MPDALTHIFEAKTKTVDLHKGIAPYSTEHQYGQESLVRAYMAGIGGLQGDWGLRRDQPSEGW